MTYDTTEPFTVFNISGNKYRLITRIDYERRHIYIREDLTHAAYDKDSREGAGSNPGHGSVAS